MMVIQWRTILLVVALGLPFLITGLEENEGESLTLTCPLPSYTLPVVWEGPKKFKHYTRGLQVSLDLSAQQRSRISVSGDNGNGYYNLDIRNLRKSDSGKYRCKIGSRVVREIRLHVRTQEEQNQGLFPYILNLATRAQISTNATCGEQRPEYFCKLVEHVDLMPERSHCDYCNARAGAGRLEEIGKPHPIRNAIDGSNKWWQSPSISNGREFNSVTITLDLGLIYQVAYVIVKAANAPRPGNWILEKSIDGITYRPWQFFAITDDDCEKMYNVQAVPGKPSYDYLRDDEVRCTSYFSKLNPLENGEILVSLTNGRPGIIVPSKTLLDFTSARYVRLRFQKIRTLNADLMSLQSRDPRNLDPSVTRRYFYSVKDISVGGQCICYGHASECQRQGTSDRLACVCQHNTCGDNCENCCPLFNQKPWIRGGVNGVRGQIVNVECEACNCHGHADACEYNATVDALSLSMNSLGEMKGGGVCIDCQDSTTGINCEQCLPGYYRPYGVSHNSRRPCRQCNCQVSLGSTGICVTDESRVNEGLMPGSCICKPGFSGQNCDRCAPGYHSYPNCVPCTCNLAGTLDPNMCEGRCVCKSNVEGDNCDRCKPGYYDLTPDNDLGCRQCFCFGVSDICQSAGLGLVQISDMRGDMDGWTIITLNDEEFTLFPNPTNDGWLEYRTFPSREQNVLNSDWSARDEVIYYWQAPVKYYGNRLASYGGQLHYKMQFTIDSSAPWQYHLAEADIILQGANMTITNGRNYIRENQVNERSISLDESNWFELEDNGRRFSSNHVSRRDFMILLYDLRRILIRATHHTAQDNVMLRDVLLDTSDAGSNSAISISGVEKCSCPRGYTGLSCESCDIGWRRLDNVLYGGTCVPCDCYGHSKTCDPYTGRCLMCSDNTEGVHCDVCRSGFYGDPTQGTPEDCQPCACPLTEVSNNFATLCTLSPTFNDPEAFICLNCAPGYAGDRCERCDNGYFGYPGLLGSKCEPCDCNGNIDPSRPGSCDQLDGTCYLCLHNTEGDDCGTCSLGYYGTANNGDCKMCNCDPFGSDNINCDARSGQCQCKEHYTGRQCDRCEAGFGDILSGCLECNCSRVGSLDYRCHPVTGQCTCRYGITGKSCDQCQPGYHGYSVHGCSDCRCYPKGANSSEICDLQTGACNCLPFVEGDHCNRCKVNYWGLESGQGCMPCDCDPVGSYFAQCDNLYGQCRCKTGVSGQKCDECIDGYYGLISLGECQECEPCTKPGHICHPETGACVCPPNTKGEKCEECIDTYWGYHPKYGCKSCDCHDQGSKNNNCDPLTGQCDCAGDYNGTHCDSCNSGLYNFPNCQYCECHLEGTETHTCDHQKGSCTCSEPNGQCLCRENTENRACDQCQDNSFSLHGDNPDGCTECFCFERGTSCEQAKYVWAQMKPVDRSVTFDKEASSMVARQRNGFYVFPSNSSWTSIRPGMSKEPLYWRVPEFTGDQTLSYHGTVRFTVRQGTRVQKSWPGSDSQPTKPLLVLTGHNFPLYYRLDFGAESNMANTFSVVLHEHYWRTARGGEVSRKLMMIILQNVTDLLIKGTWDGDAIDASLSALEIDQASKSTTLVLATPALGVEECVCPPQYSGLSCQDPADGYYRVPHIGPLDFTDLIAIIGEVRPCQCSGYSSRCDPQTGACIDCSDNTAGDRCEKCAPGYYGDPASGTPCQRCACPLATDENNFSPTCEWVNNDLVCTACEEGYSGNRCNYCAEGFYGNPTIAGGSCVDCECNLEGSVSARCDRNGICTCLQGIMGDKCDQCQPRYAVVQGECVSCDVGCTSTLMSDLDILDNMTARLPFDLSNVNITAPYRKLIYITNETRILSERLDKLQLAAVVEVQTNLGQLEREVTDGTTRSEGVLAKSRENEADGEGLSRRAMEAETTIKLLQQDIEKLIMDMEENSAASFHNRSGINVTASLMEAKQILKQIKERDFSNQGQMCNDELEEAKKTMASVQVQRLRLNNVSAVQEKLDRLEAALQDLLSQEEKSANKSEITLEKVKMLQEVLMKAKENTMEMKKLQKEMTADLKMAQNLTMVSMDALNRTEENLRVLEERASTLDPALQYLRDKENKLRDNLPDAKTAVERAVAHANNLTKYANDLEKLFEKTRLAAEDPMRAARVYDDIVRAIEEAAIAARKAIADAKNATDMVGLDNLNKAVDMALDKSKDLLKKAQDTSTQDLDSSLRDMNKRLDEVDKSQTDADDRHMDVKDELNQLPTGINNQLPTDTLNRLAEVRNTMDSADRETKEVDRRTKDIVELVNVEMMPKLQELQTLTQDQLDDIVVTMTGTQQKLSEIQNLTNSLDRRIAKSRKLKSDLSDKLSKLKQSIREAREEANKVKTSLQAQGQCVKKFRSSSQTGTLNTISFSFKAREPQKDMLIVLLQNQEVNEGDKEKEYLAIELRNRKIRFSWNVGGGSAFIDHDLEIQSDATIIREADKWYKVVAQRIGRLGRLTVHSLAKEATSPKTKTSVIGFSVMNLSDNTDLFVAGTPNGYSLPSGVTPFNFFGCMGGVYIDDQLIGLSNFETNTKDTCMHCLEVPSQDPGANLYTFDGTGYAVSDDNLLVSTLVTNIVLEFSTYWQNSTLLFIGNRTSGEYLSLELQNGKIVYQFYLGEGTYGRLESKNKYNINKWVSVAIGRNGYFGLMDIDETEVGSMVQAPKGDYLLSSKTNEIFFGGMPPSVNTDVFRKAAGKDIVTDRFLGCMRNIQVSLGTVNLWTGKTTVGVTEGCKDSGLRSIGFYGSGFAEYPGTSMDSDESDLSLSFSTMQPDGLLLLAKDINGDSFYSLSLSEGKVVGMFSGGTRPITLTSAETFNDGTIHNIAVKKTDRRMEVYVDDTVVASGRLSRNPMNNSFILVREDGGLYIGGVPNAFRINQMAMSEKSIEGCISDVVINGNVLNINKPKQYEHADIGRCFKMQTSDENPAPFASDAPAALRISDETMPAKPQDNKMTSKDDKVTNGKESNSPKMCASNPGFFDFETEAVTFGEKESSFRQINVSKKEIVRKFEITFEFRTYYRDGLFVYLSSINHSNFVGVMLKDNVLTLMFERNGDIKEVKVDSKTSLSDGNWHKVIVTKTRKRLELTVDDGTTRGAKTNKVLSIDEPLSVGGVPRTFRPLMNKKLVQHSLRGCLRNLEVNNKQYSYTEDGAKPELDKCFVTQEKGAFFTGNSYGVFASDFKVGRDMAMSLEFRTTRPEGVLLSISNQDGGDAMTLQLHQGQVKLSILNAGGKVIATTSYNGQFTLCDNMWHRVQARVTRDEVTLQVDQGEPVTVAGDGVATKTEAALYIGGISGSEKQGAALSSQGFEGCLRNVNISGQQVDWYNLEKSVAIHRTSCPA